jgi:stearoyl-CoA desaturase (Delta-9 desaturase)
LARASHVGFLLRSRIAAAFSSAGLWPESLESRSLQTSVAKFDWVNSIFLVVAHLVAASAIVWSVLHPHWETLALGLLWLVLCSLGITAGYHRLFAHRAYKANAGLRLWLLLFGAAAVQNSALRWVNDHRVHHSRVDRPEDPYNIKRGFWWAHIGWVLFYDPTQELKRVRDLQADGLVLWQHRFYVPVAIAVGGLLPGAIAWTWGDALGGVLVAGFLRLVLQYHFTFATNSVAHTFGRRTYDASTSARDSHLTALYTFGEGYHNFHHRFENDYRNGVLPWHWDPTKWFIFSLSKLGAATDLKRTPPEKIARALAMRQGHEAESLTSDRDPGVEQQADPA